MNNPIFYVALAAFIIVILSTLTPPKAPLWVAVLLLSLIALFNGLGFLR